MFYRKNNIFLGILDISFRIKVTGVTSRAPIISNILGKVGCVFHMAVISILPHVEFERKDHRNDASLFTCVIITE